MHFLIQYIALHCMQSLSFSPPRVNRALLVAMDPSGSGFSGSSDSGENLVIDAFFEDGWMDCNDYIQYAAVNLKYECACRVVAIN